MWYLQKVLTIPHPSVLASDVRMRQGRFFEGLKNRGKQEPFALPLGYNFGDVYTNRETVAVVPDCLTNWLGGTFPTYEATAKVGDMSFEISYAVPQYVKDGDGYRLILKGGIVLGVSRETTAR